MSDEKIVASLKSLNFKSIINKVNGWIDVTIAYLNDNIENGNKINNLFDITDNDKQSTADITKAVSPILTHVLKNELIHKGFSGKSGRGSDCKFGNIPIEIKTTQSNNSVTGNKHSSKTDRHLVMSYGFDKDKRYISECFVMYINLSNCVDTAWPVVNGKNAGFSCLKVSVNDIENVCVIHGDIIGKIKWASFIRKVF